MISAIQIKKKKENYGITHAPQNFQSIAEDKLIQIMINQQLNASKVSCSLASPVTAHSLLASWSVPCLPCTAQPSAGQFLLCSPDTPHCARTDAAPGGRGQVWAVLPQHRELGGLDIAWCCLGQRVVSSLLLCFHSCGTWERETFSNMAGFLTGFGELHLGEV